MNDNLDPEIASLLGINQTQKPPPAQKPVSAQKGAPPPAYETLFEGKPQAEPIEMKKSFTKITKTLGPPQKIFYDKDFYSKILKDEGEAATRFHDLFSRFLKASSPEDRSMYRGKVMPAFWDLLAQIASKIHTNLPLEKKLLLRYGLVSPTFIDQDQRDNLSRVIMQNTYGEPVYYMDEWMQRIARGQEKTSATDEVQKVKLDTAQKTLNKLDKRKGQRDAELSALRNKIDQMEQIENELLYKMKELTRHEIREDLGGLKVCYTPDQKKLFVDISELMKKLSYIDRDMGRSYDNLGGLDKEVESLSKTADTIDTDTMIVDQQALATEFNTLRQMSKLCVGRKGNHFPVLMKNYFMALVKQWGIRENVINGMAHVEAIDPGLFIRRYREQDNRIVPNVLLLPNYGEYGICWQPFEKFNRATSRGRLAIPIFSKNLTIALVSALGDLRWQVAKERAQHRWMEEGITGRYYMWFTEQKMRGDVKDYFIRDYILWITKESEGIQKLEREIRGLFWRMMPFPDAIKQRLKNRGFVYLDLYKKDQNIAMSDGY
ncbi:MAG: hypothetical protein JW822_00995 [Spirochaetales bacterium]|nr:hypothetical protein [Spirochaetales bacterium]